jgi:hypothetical protein
MSKLRTPLFLLLGLLAIISIDVALYRPDRPVSHIVPGSSPSPAFVVQIIRPRLGLPLGGLLPPKLFGLDGELGFDSNSANAEMRMVSSTQIEFHADDWQLNLILDESGKLSSATQATFPILFEERIRSVHCRPAPSAVGEFVTTPLPESNELSGHFEFKLSDCKNAETGKPLGWPTQPLLLRGSFDRLPVSKPED